MAYSNKLKIPLTSIGGSAIIARIGYDANEQILRIDYHKTGIYDYFNVTLSEFHAIASIPENESIGKRVKDVVKGKRFKRFNE